MKSKILKAVLIAFALATLASCTSTSGLSRGDIKRAIDDGTWGTPKDSCLVYGYSMDGNSEFLQQNPKYGYKFYSVSEKSVTRTIPILLLWITIETGHVCFLEPLPVGAELKAYCSESGNYITYKGIAGVDKVITKPGLLYYDNDTKDHKYEKKAIKLLYKYFKGSGSEWEQVILDRMEELTGEKND